MSRVRTVFFGTPDFARFCLEALIKDEHFEVVGVVTQPDRPSGRNLKLQPSPVKALVEPLGIPLLAADSVNTPGALAEIQKWGAEVAIVVAFGQILKQPILDLFPRKIVNVHASLLPRWRGAAPIQRAIMAGDVESGVCLQLIVPKLDAGDVIGFRKMRIDSSKNAVEILEEMKPLAADLLSVDLMDYLRGNLGPTPQDESQVTYAHKIEKSEQAIDWKKPAIFIQNQIRGLAMGPGAAGRRNESLLKIHRARAVSAVSGAPGSIVRIDQSSFTVACGEGALEILEVQAESRARQAVSEYLKGHPLKVGDILN